MDEDELPRAKLVEKRELSSMSIEELDAYIGELEDEIERVRADISAKNRHREGVEGLFKKSL